MKGNIHTKRSMAMLTIVGALLMLSLFTNVSHADETILGAYAGAGVGRATLHRERIFRSGIEAHDTGFKALLGYRTHRGMAFEASYADLGDITKRNRLAGDIDAFSVAIVGLIPLRRVELFGKAGFGAWRGTTANNAGTHVRDNDIDPALGMGVQLRSGRLAVRAEAEAQLLSFAAGEHGRDGDWVDFISIGANWSF